MVSNEEMRFGNILTLFCRFGFPAVVGVATAGVQEIIDCFFIGNFIGSEGLAGITLAYPLYIFIIAIGILIGIGSSSLIALELGRGNKTEALDIAHNALPYALL